MFVFSPSNSTHTFADASIAPAFSFTYFILLLSYSVAAVLAVIFFVARILDVLKFPVIILNCIKQSKFLSVFSNWV